MSNVKYILTVILNGEHDGTWELSAQTRSSALKEAAFIIDMNEYLEEDDIETRLMKLDKI